MARRLELLSAELAGVRGDPPVQPREPPHDQEHPPPPLVPEPGRHAARRGGASERWLPEPVRGRVGLGAPQLAVVAVLVALGLAATTWWVVRADPDPVAPVAPAAAPTEALASPAGDPSPAAGEAGGAAEGSVTVDVAGKVRRPGIAVLDSGARVVDAIKASGGVRPGVDLGDLNLARVLVDGEQVMVGVAAPAAVPPGASAPAPAPSGAATLVNINTADLTLLETLPEVGPVTAQAIVSWRDSNGGFTAVEELLEVDGIGEATLASMAPFVTV